MGVLGINERNARYISKYNPRRLYPLVDDKLKTKKLALAAGISVPKLYGVVEIDRQIRDLPTLLAPYNDFVIKPAHGSGGAGVLVISAKNKGLYRTVSGFLMNDEEVAFHATNILSGMYSLGGRPDSALIEYRVKFDPVFESVSFQGVPDVRIIVFQGVPVMSMLRLPTRASDGKANLHKGAIGVGIQTSTGETMTAVWKNSIVNEHPDTGATIIGLQMPKWDILLNLASQCYELTGLGYQGVDIVLDKDLGPLILEVNARPGLSIQIANRAGLVPRLNLVHKHISELDTVEKRVAFARKNF